MPHSFPAFPNSFCFVFLRGRELGDFEVEGPLRRHLNQLGSLAKHNGNQSRVRKNSFMERKVTEAMGNLKNAAWTVGRNEKRWLHSWTPPPNLTALLLVGPKICCKESFS